MALLESCLPGSELSKISISYESMNGLILAFFSKYLNDEPSLFDNRHYAEGDNEYIIEMEIDFSNITTLCNTLLDNNMDLATKQVQAHKDEFIAVRNQLNLLARMVINKDQSIWLYQESLKYEPDSWQTYYDMAITYKNHGDITLAKDAVIKAQEMNPENDEINWTMDSNYKYSEEDLLIDEGNLKIITIKDKSVLRYCPKMIHT